MFGFYVGIIISVAVGVFVGGLILRGVENMIEDFFGF